MHTVMLTPLAPVDSGLDVSTAAVENSMSLAVQASWHEIPEATMLHTVCHEPLNPTRVV